MDDGGDAGLEWIRDATLCELLEVDHRDIVNARPPTATTATATATATSEMGQAQVTTNEKDNSQGRMGNADKAGNNKMGADKTSGGDQSTLGKAQSSTATATTAAGAAAGVKPGPMPRPPVLLTDYVTDLVTAVLYAPTDRDNFVRWYNHTLAYR